MAGTLSAVAQASLDAEVVAEAPIIAVVAAMLEPTEGAGEVGFSPNDGSLNVVLLLCAMLTVLLGGAAGAIACGAAAWWMLR